MGRTSPRDSSWCFHISIPCFGATSDFSEVPAESGSNVHPRWSHHGEYELGYQPGKHFCRFHAFGYSVPGRPRFALSLSSLQDSPAFIKDHSSWYSPSWTQMSSASLKPQLPVGASALPVISLVQSLANGTWCPDTPVQWAHPGELQSAGLGTSLYQAWLDDRRDLDPTWLKLLLVMGDSSVLTQSTGAFCHAQVHQLRVFSKVALNISQSIFRIWQHWFEFVSIWYACPSRPSTFLRTKLLAAHAHAPSPRATAYFKGPPGMAKEALRSKLIALFHSLVCRPIGCPQRSEYIGSQRLGHSRLLFFWSANACRRL